MNLPVPERHAEIIDPATPEGTLRMNQLASRADYCVIDTIQSQIIDLIRARNLTPSLSREDIDALAADFLQKHGRDYGNWIHYPWRKSLVRLLPKEEFVELRTNRNSHKITRQEQHTLSEKRIGIVGLSVGQSVALTVAMERVCGELRIADFDRVDLSNLNRLRCSISDIGTAKTTLAAREIAELDPYLKVVCFDDGLTRQNCDTFLDGLDLVVDECDSLDVKLSIRNAARSRGLPVIMNTSDQGMTDIERFDAEPDRPVFHGLLGDTSTDTLTNLSTEEKIPLVMKMVGLTTTSSRLRASLLEIGQSISTWPQLASDVMLGGAIVCDCARRILLGEPVSSGRFFLRLDSIGNLDSPNANAPSDIATSGTDHANRKEKRASESTIFDRIIEEASCAPSAGNTQPWEWLSSASSQSLTLRRRFCDGGSAFYHDGHASSVGLGAALESAIISASHYGFDCTITGDLVSEHAICLNLRARTSASEDIHYSQLSRRKCVRARPKRIDPISGAIREALNEQAHRFPGFHLSYRSDRDSIESVARSIGIAERMRVLDPTSHKDMMSEISWSEENHLSNGEGIPLSALGLSESEETALQILRDPAVPSHLRDWNLGHGLTRIAEDLIRTSSAIGLLWSEDNHAQAYVTGGRTLQRIWLEATRHDIGLCPVTAACYLLSAWRSQHPFSKQDSAVLAEIEACFRDVFDIPNHRTDIALFRLVPAREILRQPRLTLRRPVNSALSNEVAKETGCASDVKTI